MEVLHITPISHVYTYFLLSCLYSAGFVWCLHCPLPVLGPISVSLIYQCKCYRLNHIIGESIILSCQAIIISMQWLVQPYIPTMPLYIFPRSFYNLRQNIQNSRVGDYSYSICQNLLLSWQIQQKLENNKTLRKRRLIFYKRSRIQISSNTSQLCIWTVEAVGVTISQRGV